MTREFVLESVHQDPRPDTAPSVLEVRGVTRRYGDRMVLEDANLELRAGEIASVAGANGAGKTTLLRIVSGLILPDSGSVLIENLNPERDRREYQRKVGFLSAGDRGLYARLTVRNNLEFWGRLAFIDGKRLRGEIDRTVARFALEELSSRRVDRLSMGQRQRVRLAMAFLHSPRLVLLDEPRTSLDSDGTQLLTEALREHCAQGGAAIWCAPTGDSDPLDFDRHYVVEHGRLTSS